jgi:phosphoadenosine phosphosulfate reductase
MLQSFAPGTPIVFINTGYHFPETLAYRDELLARYAFNLVEVGPAISQEELVQTHGPELFRRDPDRCCEINKVEPLRRALRGVRGWINGRRRDQAATRREHGYTSIGCAPCTRPVLAGEDERAGRWAGQGKVECGIHTAFNDPGRDI